MKLFQSSWLGVMLLSFSLCKPNLYCLGTTTGPFLNLKLYLLPFSEGTIGHPLKLVPVEEEVFTPFCSDEPKAMVSNPSDCALWHVILPLLSPETAWLVIR